MSKNRIIVYAIISVIAIAAAGISWYMSTKSISVELPPFTETPLIETKIIITTDKTEYEQGETVQISIKNNFLEERVILGDGYSVEFFNNNTWQAVSRVVCPCGADCLRSIMTLAPQEIKTFEWNQQESWCEYSPIQEKSKQASHGLYRMKSTISKPGDYSDKITVYSNEFTIKEAISPQAKCAELEQALYAEIKKQSFCETADDCVESPENLSGIACCGYVVSKNANLTEAKQLVAAYINNGCSIGDCMCRATTGVQCISNKCEFIFQ